MLFESLQLLLFVGFPGVSLWLARRFKFFEALSPVVICYGFGIFLGNLTFLPLSRELARSVAELAVPIALPLLLFSSDFKGWLRLARKTVLSFSLACVSVMISSAWVAFLFADITPQAWKVAGMLVGVYTGGTPNMSAIGLSLNVKEELFVLLNGADVIVSSIYLLFLMTAAPRVLRFFLPSFAQSKKRCGKLPLVSTALGDLPFKERARNSFASLALSLFCVGAAAGLSFFFAGQVSTVFVVLSITTLGVGLSFVPGVRQLKGSYELGEYLLLIFCVAVGTLASVQELASASATLLAHVALVVAGSVLLHLLLAFLFQIDVDTVIITSTAAVFGPAFVGPIANVLKNREIVVSGLTTGLMGYAVGNYLGLLEAFLLKP